MTNADENTSDERERNGDDPREERVYLDKALRTPWGIEERVEVFRDLDGDIALLPKWGGVWLEDECWRKVIDALERALADRGDS